MAQDDFFIGTQKLLPIEAEGGTNFPTVDELMKMLEAPRRECVSFIWPNGGDKSGLVMAAALKAMGEGMIVFLDYEASFDSKWARRMLSDPVDIDLEEMADEAIYESCRKLAYEHEDFVDTEFAGLA